MSEELKPSILAEKILKIQGAAGMVKKRGKFGSEMGGGGYLRIEDAVLAVGKLMVSEGLLLTGTLHTKQDGGFWYERLAHTTKGYIASVVVEWKIEDVKSGEFRLYHFPGDGYDGTDKAIYKALTGSRKYAIIYIFNLAVGNDAEAQREPNFEDAKKAAKAVASTKLADAAGRGNKTAIDAMSQVAQEKTLIITRPEEYNGHYFIASGFIAAPPLDQFFEDTGCKRIDSRKTGKIGWKVSADYEKGLIQLCENLGIEVEG